MELWKRKRRQPQVPAPPGPIQIRESNRHPFRLLDGYLPLHQPEFELYRSIREAIPVVDAAILKLIRLAGGVKATCGDKGAEAGLKEFFRTVPVGWNQRGIQTFLDAYLDCLLTCGRAVGEIVPSRDGREVAAVLCGNIAQMQVKPTESPLELILGRREENGQIVALPRQDLLLFTPNNPNPENPFGVSLLHSLPFLSGILLKIYQTLGTNWERAGNVRFSVIYKPTEDALDARRAQERSRQLAQEWGAAMQNTKAGSVRDFVAVGDVEIKVIGGECEIPESQVPVRQILEQLIAQTGIPPFLLGLNWSSTERMSSQQADIMTSEITALRRTVTPVLEKIATYWLHMHGYGCPVKIQWEDINLQDQVEEAKAALYLQQAKKLERENHQKQEERNERDQADPSGTGEDDPGADDDRTDDDGTDDPKLPNPTRGDGGH